MIDITHPFHKTLWFMEQYTKGSNFSFLEGNEQGKTCLDFLEEILNFEVKKEKYKKSLLQYHSFDNILHFEHSNIEYTLEALKELKIAKKYGLLPNHANILFFQKLLLLAI